MKKTLFVAALSMSALSFAKTGNPVKEKDDSSCFKTEKTTKDEATKNKIEISVKKESSAGCFLIAAVQSSLGIPTNWAYCIGLYEAGL